MPQVALPEIVQSDSKVECWFEVNLDFKEDALRGRPTRIFASDDPRWKVMLADPKLKTKMGCLSFGAYQASGEDFIPNSVRIDAMRQMRILEAYEKMVDFETRGVIDDTPRADALKNELEKENRAQDRQAKVIADSLAQALHPRETARIAK